MRKDLENGFDEDYARKSYDFSRRIRFEHRFFNETIVNGLGNLDEERQKVYLPNHLSHYDYLALWHIFMRAGIKVPRFAAGKNLDLPNFVERWGFNFRKQGVFFIDRDMTKGKGLGNRKYIEELKNALNQMIDVGEDILVFTEGGRNYEGKVMPDGRKIKGLTYQTLSESGRDIDVIPVAMGYNRRIEETGLKLLKRLKGKIGRLERPLFNTSDLISFGSRALLRSTLLMKLGFNVEGKCYVNFGEPLKLKDYSEWKELRHDVVGNVRELYKEIEGMK